MRQANYEQALTKLGVEFQYQDKIPLDEINVTRGKQMQARLQPLDHDLIDRYEEMLRDGFEPPPLLLWKHGRGLLIPLDGNQRIAANAQCNGKVKLKAFSAYVITTDDPMIADRICWTWNNMVNGRRLSHEECIEHAITFVRKYGQTQAQAAKEWGVKQWELCAKINVLECRELAGKANFEIPRPIGDDTILTLNQLRKIGEDIATKALKVASENGFTVADAKELCAEVQKAPNAKEKEKAVDTFAVSERIRRRKAETRGGTMRPFRLPRQQLQKLLEGFEDLLDRYPDKKAFKPVGKEDQERYSATARKVANHLISIYGLGAFLHGDD